VVSISAVFLFPSADFLEFGMRNSEFGIFIPRAKGARSIKIRAFVRHRRKYLIPKICVNLRHLRLKQNQRPEFCSLFVLTTNNPKIISENPRNPRNQRIKKQRWIFVRFWLLARHLYSAREAR
jgi:hypothetical protein